MEFPGTLKSLSFASRPSTTPYLWKPSEILVIAFLFLRNGLLHRFRVLKSPSRPPGSLYCNGRPQLSLKGGDPPKKKPC